MIFSHSDARGLNDHPRDVSDAVLKLVAANGGVVMVAFAPSYLTEAYRHWDADHSAERTRLNAPPFGGLYIGQPDKAAEAMKAWEKEHPAPKVSVIDVADHIEHVAKVAGYDNVGLGSDFDGLGGNLPEGIKDVSYYPALLAELMKRGWTDEQIAKLAGENVLRVMAGAEKVAASMKGELPGTAVLPGAGVKPE